MSLQVNAVPRESAGTTIWGEARRKKQMPTTIAIIGAGTLGGALAHRLASTDQATRVLLIDPAAGIAAGKALDINQAGPVERFDTRVSGAQFDEVIGASTVVLADPAERPDGDWTRDEATHWLEQAAGLVRRAPLVLAGAGHRSLVAHAVETVGIAPRRVIGSAPVGFSSALQAITALETGTSPSQVAVSVVGAPPTYPVIGWSHATAGGKALEQALSPPQLQQLRQRAARLWPPGPYTLAAAAVSLINAILSGSERTFSCFVARPTGGVPAMEATAVPVRVGPHGIESEVEPSLSQREQVELERSLST